MKDIETEINLENKLANNSIEEILDEMDKEIANPNSKLLTHEEVFTQLRSRLNDK